MFEMLYIALAIFLAYVISIAIMYWIIERRANSFIDKIKTEYEVQKKKSNEIARNVLRGQITQHFVPFRSPELADISPHDMRFMGDACDLIAFKGYTDAKDKVEGAEVEEVIFIEVKSGDAKLSAYQESVKKAIDEKRVSFRIVTAPSELGEW
jgi:predicted Holliday junction resolvase-like endonuclease